MEKFTIGGKEYDANVTYRVRRFWIDACDKGKASKMTLGDSDELVLKSIIICLPQSEFKKTEQLYDVLSDDEFNTLEAFFSKILSNPKLEGKTDIEKKPEQTSAM